MVGPELLKKVRQIHIKTNHLVDADFAGSYQSAFRGKGMEFQEVRHYVAGDDIRDIDWNVTARLGEPYVKIFQEERELSVMLLVDMSASGIFGSHGYLKRHLIAELAAVLAFSATKNNDKVGVVLFTDHVEQVILPKKGRGHVWRVIREILQFESRGHKTSLAEALNLFNHLLPRRSVCFLISDFMDEPTYQQPLRIAAKKHDLIGLVIRDPLERQLPNVGLLQIEDPESGDTMLIDTTDRHFRKQVESLVVKKDTEIKNRLVQAGASCLFLSSTGDYLRELLNLFRRREGRR